MPRTNLSGCGSCALAPSVQPKCSETPSAFSPWSLKGQGTLGLVSKIVPHTNQQLNLNESIHDQNSILEPAIYFGLKAKPRATAASDPHPRSESLSQMAFTAGGVKQSILSNQLFPEAFVPRIFQSQDQHCRSQAVVTKGAAGPVPAVNLGRPGPNGWTYLQLSLAEPSRPSP